MNKSLISSRAASMWQILSVLTVLLCLGVAGGRMAAASGEQPFSFSGEIKVTKISDGDSVRSGPLKIRLHGVDAPEIQQVCRDANGAEWSCGKIAKDALESLIAEAPSLRCDLLDMDRYGRLVMRCFAGDIDIAKAMVANGMALAYRAYSSEYVAFENAAQANQRGLWQGKFDAPWDWRRKKREAQKQKKKTKNP